MRYREGGTPGIADYGSTEGFLVATVVFTLLTGIVFVVAGRYGRQLWLIFWGALSILVCSVYLLLMGVGSI